MKLVRLDIMLMLLLLCLSVWDETPTVGLEPTTTRLRALRSAD